MNLLCLAAARAYIYRHFNAETFVTVDSKMSLVCVAAGNPPPTITWSLDDAPLTPNDDDDDKSRYVVVTSVTPDGDVVSYVNVSSIRVADGGTYRCTARNRVGVEAFSGKLFVYGTRVNCQSRMIDSQLQQSRLGGGIMFSTCPSVPFVTNLVNTIFLKQINRCCCKLAQVYYSLLLRG